ncbi:MAG: TlpA family protein disulfide reductase [Bryobacteraceae bacterium]
MLRSWILLIAAAMAAPAASLVSEVRAAIGKQDFAGAERLIRTRQSDGGDTPEVILAISWMGRGSLAAKRLDQAGAWAGETRKLALDALTRRALDADENLPLALGASIEVQAHVLDQQGRRAEAVAFLRRELETYRGASIRVRIQKNLHLLNLEGKPAPELEKLALPKGRPVVLFFWAHWCPDCKRHAPLLERLASQYKDLAILGPTQRYGYVAGGIEAGAAEESAYIEQVRRQFYGRLLPEAPVSEENFKRYGASSTPTLVFVDRKGIVRLYHPGQMTAEALEAAVAKIAGP